MWILSRCLISFCGGNSRKHFRRHDVPDCAMKQRPEKVESSRTLVFKRSGTDAFHIHIRLPHHRLAALYRCHLMHLGLYAT